MRRRIAVLAKRGLEDQLAVRDFSQSYVGMTHSGSELDEWTMPEGELTDTTRNDVHKNLLIVDYFSGGFDEFGVHNRFR